MSIFDSHMQNAMCGRCFFFVYKFSFRPFCFVASFLFFFFLFFVQLIIDIISNVSKHRPAIFHHIKAEPHHIATEKISANWYFLPFITVAHVNVRKMSREHCFPLSHSSFLSLGPAYDTLSTCYSTHTPHCHTASLSRPFLRPHLSYFWHARSRNINYVITTPTTTTITTTTTTAEAAQFSVTALNRKRDNDAFFIPLAFFF